MANVQRPNIDAGRLLIFYVTSLSWLGVGRPGQHKTSAVSLAVTSAYETNTVDTFLACFNQNLMAQ